MTASFLPPDADVPLRSVSLRRLLAGEIAVSTIINVAFNFFFAWLLFPVGATIPLWGAHGLAIDVVPASFVPAAMMTLAVSAIMRRRLRAGLRVVTAARLPIGLPSAMIPRALAIGVLALPLVALPTVLLLSLSWNDAWGWTQVVPFKLAFSLFHAAIVTPVVILTVLQRHEPSERSMLP